MESPVRSVGTTAGGGSGENGGGSKNQEGEATTPSATAAASQRFEAKSYLERQVEEHSCADEEEAQERVSKRLQLKHERAQKKRDIQLQHRREGIAERLRKIGEARAAVDARFAENAAELMERQTEKQTSATRRRRTSLENIKKSRAIHNRRVNQRRRESFDATSDLSPTRSKGMDEYELKLARAERNREALRCERRRRTMERYEEGRARALQQGLLGFGGGGAAAGGRVSTSVRAGAGVEAGREHRRRRAMEARQAAKARQTQRMRHLRQRMLTNNSRVGERKTRVYAARLLQAWWSCIRDGKPFHVANLAITSAEGPPDRSILGSPSTWAADHGLGLSLAEEGIEPSVNGSGKPTAASSRSAPRSPLDPCTKSPLPTFRKFSAGVSSQSLCAAEGMEPLRVGMVVVEGGAFDGAGSGGGANSPTTGFGFGSSYKAAVRIQSFLRRNMHSLKVAKALLAARPSIKVLCCSVHTMETSTFVEAIDVMSMRSVVGHCETALKALRMGREMRCVPQTVRSARAFLSALLVNFFPNSALDDEGVLSSSPEGTAPLQLEKERLVRAAGHAITAFLNLGSTVDAAVVDAEAGAIIAGTDRPRPALSAEQFRRLKRASATMVRARVAFCQRFAEWKRKDAVRLADEMTAASVDVLLMQLRAERDLRVAAVRYGLDETDDDGALFSTGYDQIKEGTQRQLGKMMHALGTLVGADAARQRMDEATDAAFERLRADELAEDEAFMREHADFADESMMMDTDDNDHHHHSGSQQQQQQQQQRSAMASAPAGRFDSGKTSESTSHGGGGESVGGTTSEAAATMLLEGKTAAEDENDIAGPRRPLSAGDLLSNEWLVHEVMISNESLTITLDEAIDNQLLRSGNPAAAGGSRAAGEEFWANVERNVAAEDYTPLLGLVAELRDKIIGLTPRRRDLAAETCEAMDVELLQQMMSYGAFDVGSFFRMVAFAGERVLELEAPIRNDGTKATLAGWGRTQAEVEGGRRRLEPAMVRMCFEYLFSKTDEIHVDILNAHLQFVTPFLKQHGVEYERDRFTERLDAGEVSLDMTHLWLHRAIRQLRTAAGGGASPATAETTAAATTATPASAASPSSPSTPPLPPTVTPETLFYRQLLSDLEQRRGDAYLKLLRVAIVDNLLGAIVRVERKSTNNKSSKVGAAATAAAAAGGGSGKPEGLPRDDQQEDMLDGVAVPETLNLDQYRLVVVAAGAEQAAYTASLLAFARQALAGVGVPLAGENEKRMRDALMVLFETEDVTSADICAQVAEMTRLVAVVSERVLPTPELNMLTSRSKNVLTTGNCPVYKLFLRRTLGILRDTLVEGGMPEERFVGVLRKAGLSDYKTFLLERVVRPLMVIERHNEAVFATFYNEIIPLALQTTDPAAAGAHANALNVD